MRKVRFQKIGGQPIRLVRYDGEPLPNFLESSVSAREWLSSNREVTEGPRGEVHVCCWGNRQATPHEIQHIENLLRELDSQ